MWSQHVLVKNISFKFVKQTKLKLPNNLQCNYGILLVKYTRKKITKTST